MNEKVIVILKETGKLVALDKRAEFNPRFHAWREEVKVEASEAPEQKTAEELKARFQELKDQKAWLVSKPQELRDEYSALKKILEA